MSGVRFVPNERLRSAKLNRLVTTAEAPLDGGLYARQGGAWVPVRSSIETVSTTTHTPVVGTDGRWFRCTNASGCAVTIPTDAAQAHPVGTMLTYEQNAAVAVTFTAAGGVTLRVPAQYVATTAERYGVVQVCKVATNEWVLYGHLLAA
jgi:hypothetical protein